MLWEHIDLSPDVSTNMLMSTVFEEKLEFKQTNNVQNGGAKEVSISQPGTWFRMKLNNFP